ncbi:MAG: Crp/Fnr family transcriptional regulator [Acidobacteria bacterium]|nr:Crp/Fnr family transcriptional regulator [Acidobacteriota bacterium]
MALSTVNRAAPHVSDQANFNQLLRSLGIQRLEALRSHLKPVRLEAEQRLFGSFVGSSHAYFPTTAVISHQVVSMEGETLEIVMIGNEGVSGLRFEGPVATYHSVVAVAGDALKMDLDLIRSEAQRGGRFTEALIEYQGVQLSQIAQRMFCRAFHHVDQKLCSWLLMLDDRVSGTRLPLTHEQLSTYLGASRVTITLAARALKEQGLIEYMRGKLTIIDRASIEEAACECYSIQKELFKARIK